MATHHKEAEQHVRDPWFSGRASYLLRPRTDNVMGCMLVSFLNFV
jgi:hypothetical protein